MRQKTWRRENSFGLYTVYKLGNLRNKKATTNQYNFSISRFGTKLEKYIKYKDFLPVPSPVQELFKERRLFFFISV